MILSGLKIKEEVLAGNITITPFNEDMLNPNSYNYRLSNTLLEVIEDIIDPQKETQYKEIIIPEEGYVLQPNTLYLANTSEFIGSDKYVTQLIGRSSVGRLGLFLQITAPIGHVGCCSKWTLELKVVQPLRIYPNMKIGQVTFWNIEGETSLNYKDGYYNKMEKPYISGFFERGIL